MSKHFLVSPEGFVGTVKVAVVEMGGRLSKETAQELGLPWGDDGGCDTWHHYRLHRCACGQKFIAWHAAKSCSPACAAVRQAEMLAKHRRPAKPKEPPITLSERRRQRREKLVCDVCRQPLSAERSSRKFCSDRCRQWRHRHPWGQPTWAYKQAAD